MSFYLTKVKKLFYPCNIFLILQQINCATKSATGGKSKKVCVIIG